MNLPWYTHSTLQRFLRIDISIINDEALRIGVGRAAPLKAVDLPVVTIRLPKGNMPYIPGSSLKGVIRSTCEFIAKSSGIEGVCMAGACGNKFADPEQEVTYHAAIDRALRSNDHQGVIEILARYCLICKAFGSSSFGSHVEFQDAYSSGSVVLGVKSGIAINRRSGAVRRGALYEVEYVEPGHEFSGSITVRNLPNYLMGLISSALDYLNAGIVKLGGFKSRGFGKVSIKVTKIEGHVLDPELGAHRPLSEVKSLKALDEHDGDVEMDLSDIPKTLNEFRRRWEAYVQVARRSRTS